MSHEKHYLSLDDNQFYLYYLDFDVFYTPNSGSIQRRVGQFSPKTHKRISFKNFKFRRIIKGGGPWNDSYHPENDN